MLWRIVVLLRMISEPTVPTGSMRVSMTNLVITLLLSLYQIWHWSHRFDASQEIRNGHITRDEAISLAAKFEGEFPKRYQQDCLEFMGVTEDEFASVTDAARSPHLWKKVGSDWVLTQELEEIMDARSEFTE